MIGIAYNKESLKNLDVVKEARVWWKSGIIDEAQFNSIAQEYKVDFFHPNLFIRILLFIATLIALSGVTGLLGLMFVDAFEDAIGFLCLIYGVGSFFVLDRVFVSGSRHYKSGVNEGLLYHSIGFTVAGMSVMFDAEVIGVLCFAVIVFAFAAVRYLDLISTAGTVVCFGYLIFEILFQSSPLMQNLIPIFMIAVFTPFYFFIKALKKNTYNWPWFDCLIVAEAVALIFIYAAGNYFVVRELSTSLLGLYLDEGQDIPFAYVFYSLTVVIPLVYLYYGIRNKDIVLIRVSLLALAFSVFTFKFYYSTGHHEITFTAAGILLTGAAYMLFRYLKTPKNGYTADNVMKESWAEANPEAILISQTLGGNAVVVEEAPSGGGEFGGGGATGGY